MENIELNIKLKTKDMYEFQMRHSYLSVTGIVAVLVSVASFVYFLISHNNNDKITNILLILASLLFTVIYPLQMLNRSFSIVKFSPILSKTLNYVFTSEGILVSLDEEDSLLPWESISKVIETHNLILVYTSPKVGYILPKRQYEDKCSSVKEMIKKQIDKEKCVLQLRDK